MQQLRSHWKDIHEILYVNIFRKPVYKIRGSLQADKNNRYFTWEPVYTYNISLNSP